MTTNEQLPKDSEQTTSKRREKYIPSAKTLERRAFKRRGERIATNKDQFTGKTNTIHKPH